MAYTPHAVTTIAPDPNVLLGYQLRLPSFEGPLDVLLRLIERSQLQIADVSLVAVTDQFLDHIAALGGGDPEAIADFTSVGTRLVLLKSRALLPRAPGIAEEESPSDLTTELIEYRAVKLAAIALGERDRRGEGAFARAPGAWAMTPEMIAPKLAHHEPNWLAGAIRRRLTAVASPHGRMQVKPLISLREMIERILCSFANHSTSRFSTIAGQCRDLHELRTAFLALLVLVRQRSIDAEQELPFGEITLSPVPAPLPAITSDFDAFGASH